MMMQSPFNLAYIDRIIYSKEFRSLQDKTQLFYPSQKLRVRTRLTHTMEVRTIAHKIACRLNERINAYHAELDNAQDFITRRINPADVELIDAIALAHDIGHTPFGHIGERTIDAVVSGEDSLGGLIRMNGSTAMRFKHNSNALRILVELGVEDWRITEGALSHTKICYKKDTTRYNCNPFNPFADTAYNKLMQFILSLNGLDFNSEDKRTPPSLTLEGQIVAMADEIAQRAADLGDAKIQARYLDSMEKLLAGYLNGKKSPDTIRADPYSRLEWVILTAMTEDIAMETFRNLVKTAPESAKHGGITHCIYKEKVAAFSSGMHGINDTLDSFVGSYLAQSEEVRESDSRSKYIIRQLYKAYVNDVTLLPDAFLEKHLTAIAKGNSFRYAFESVKHDTGKDPGKTFEKISRMSWHVKSDIIKKSHKQLLDMGTVKDYFAILRENSAKTDGRNPKIDPLLDAFILDVGFYIAGLTNTEAFDAYNVIYGHKL